MILEKIYNIEEMTHFSILIAVIQTIILITVSTMLFIPAIEKVKSLSDDKFKIKNGIKIFLKPFSYLFFIAILLIFLGDICVTQKIPRDSENQNYFSAIAKRINPPTIVNIDSGFCDPGGCQDILDKEVNYSNTKLFMKNFSFLNFGTLTFLYISSSVIFTLAIILKYCVNMKYVFMKIIPFFVTSLLLDFIFFDLFYFDLTKIIIIIIFFQLLFQIFDAYKETKNKT